VLLTASQIDPSLLPFLDASNAPEEAAALARLNDEQIEPTIRRGLGYVQYLRRTWDIPGLNFWLGNLNSCVSASTSFFSCPGCSTQCYYDSINAFLSSTEYRSRFGCP